MPSGFYLSLWSIIMHCKECDEMLTDNEAVYKSHANGKYLNLCSECIPNRITSPYELSPMDRPTPEGLPSEARKKAIEICKLSDKIDGA
jgi:hypothetical protein